MEKDERYRQLLAKICNHFCDSNKAELARRIEKDPSYVNRQFYPRDKKGAKGIGLDTMDACNKAFKLPKGFWDMHPDEVNFDEHVIPGQPDTEARDDDIEIVQYQETGGGMGRSHLVLADQPGVIKKWHVSQDWLRLNVREYTSVENLRIVTGFGHSMRPMFNPGDPLLVDVGVSKIEQEGVFFFRIGDDGYIKTLQRIPQPGGGRLIKAKSRNTEEFDDFMIDEKTMDFHVLAKVLTVWRSEQY